MSRAVRGPRCRGRAMGSRPADYTVGALSLARYLLLGYQMRIALVGLVLLPALMLSACAARSTPPSTPSVPAASRAILEVRQGLASYYGPGFEGKRTASGIPFDKTAMVAAHPTYPFGTVVRVTNLANNRRVELRVVDRGPAKGPRAQGVLIDVSSGAAANLGFIRQGRTKVRLEVLRWGS
jgi:peptidoglycan lytic transglycosylase